MDNCLIDLYNLLDIDQRINFVEDNYFGGRQYEERGNIIIILTRELEIRDDFVADDIKQLVNNHTNSIKQAIINLMKKRVRELNEIDNRTPLPSSQREYYDDGMITGRYTELEDWIDKISKM